MELSWTRRFWEAQVVDIWHSLCVMPDALAACLSQICLSSCPWVNLLHLSRCLCVFICFFVWFTSLSLSFIHSDYALTNLASLGAAVMTSSDIHTASCFFKRWLIFFRIKDSSPPWFDQESAPMGLQKFPMKGGKASFIKRIAGTFGLLKILVMIFFLWIFSTNLEWWNVFIIIWFFYGFFRWLVRDWISKTSPLQRFHDYFHTTLLVVEIITKKIHQFNGTTLNPSKTTM